MGKMDDPLRLDAERFIDELHHNHPSRVHEIEGIQENLSRAFDTTNRPVRGVKGTRGRPSVNKSKISAFLVIFRDLFEFSTWEFQSGRTGMVWEKRVPSGREIAERVAKLELEYIPNKKANPQPHSLNSASTVRRYVTSLDCFAIPAGFDFDFELRNSLSFYFHKPSLFFIDMFSWPNKLLFEQNLSSWHELELDNSKNSWDRSWPLGLVHDEDIDFRIPPINKSAYKKLQHGFEMHDAFSFNVTRKFLKQKSGS